jgi:hypothetical protein
MKKAAVIISVVLFFGFISLTMLTYIFFSCACGPAEKTNENNSVPNARPVSKRSQPSRYLLTPPENSLSDKK